MSHTFIKIREVLLLSVLGMFQVMATESDLRLTTKDEGLSTLLHPLSKMNDSPFMSSIEDSKKQMTGPTFLYSVNPQNKIPNDRPYIAALDSSLSGSEEN